MTLQTFRGGVYFPDPILGQSLYLKDDSSILAISASGAKAAVLFDAPFTGNIDRVFAYVGAHTTGGTLDVRLETIDATTGLPSGTLVAANTNGAFVTSATGAIDVTLTAVAPVTKGTQYALVIVQAAGNCVIRVGLASSQVTGNTGGASLVNRRGHTAYASAGTYASRTNSSTYSLSPYAAFHFDNGSYYPTKSIFPISTCAVVTFNNTTTARERGIAFSLPFPARATGFFLLGDLTASDANVVLATTAGTALLTASLDKDLYAAYATGTNYGGTYVGYWSTEQALTANTTYYLTVVPQSASSVMLREVTLISGASIAGQMDGLTGGQNCVLVTRASGGSYTTTATQRPIGMGVILDQFDDGAGGSGGLLIDPGFTGNLNG